MYLAIVDHVGAPYNGSTPSERALGGSESAVVFIARELNKIGISVDVWCDLEGEPYVYDGVQYVDRKWKPDFVTEYDVVISSRSVTPFIEGYYDHIKGRKKIIWMHDTFCDGDHLLESMLVNDQIDEVWTLSDFHTSYITTCNHGHKRMLEVIKRKIWQTRNGCNLYTDYVDLHNRDKYLYVWNASTSKGLRTLLEDVWPKFQQFLPPAKLKVIGGYYQLREDDQQKIEWDKLVAEHAGKHNVEFTGLIDQKSVSEILTKASFMVYPQSLPETYGISALEAQAHGVPIITGRFGALEEVCLEDANYLMDYPVDSNPLYTFDKASHVDRFVKKMMYAWNDWYGYDQKANKGLTVREVCTWDTIALQWKQHLWKITGRYLPRDEFRKVMYINNRVKQIFNTRWTNPEEYVYYPKRDEQYMAVIVTFKNAEKYIKKCVESILAQDYSNYSIIFVDDASTDNTWKVLNECTAGVNRARFIRNKESVGALANQITAIDEFAYPSPGNDPIIVLVDGDDALANDPFIFKKINDLHINHDVTYGSMWSLADNIPLIAQEYPPEIKENGAYKTFKFQWNIPYTHLRTFKASLAVVYCDDDTLRDSNGSYYRAGGDAALFYAILAAVPPDRIAAVRDIFYLYNDLNPDNDYKINAEEQQKNLNEILSK